VSRSAGQLRQDEQTALLAIKVPVTCVSPLSVWKSGQILFGDGMIDAAADSRV